MMTESEYCSEVIEANLINLLFLLKIIMKILNILLNVGFVKAYEGKRSCLYTRKYWRSTHQEYNLNLRLSKKVPVVLHNLQSYD